MCKVDGCDREKRAEGMCLFHYNKKRRASFVIDDPNAYWEFVKKELKIK